MTTRFRNALVRPPGPDFSGGLTTATLGPPFLEIALEQHERYCAALEACGVVLTRLEALPGYPDSTFVEDTAVLTDRCAILTRPGAVSRRGEVPTVGKALGRFYPSLREIQPPGTLDGGDICQAGERFFIGISERTSDDVARQLAAFLAEEGYVSTLVDIREMEGLLHLKSGMAYLGDGRLVLAGALVGHQAFRDYDVLRVETAEEYAANCVRVNDYVLVAEGYPAVSTAIEGLGYAVITLEMSEFRKMDGGLSCLSLRY